MKTNTDDLGVVGIMVEDWDITKSFKPKTITTDYSSWICYISRRAVPANTPITDSYYWKPITRLQSELAFDYNTFKSYVEARLKSMDLKIETFLQSAAGGTSLTDQFGTSEFVAVNQKVHTEAINDIYNLLQTITGVTYKGISLTVTPEYFIVESGANVVISANTLNTTGIFEHIEFQINGIVVYQADNVETVSYETTITETSIVKCVAKIMGIEYTQQKVITHYNSFFLGAGTTYTDLMINPTTFNPDYAIPIENGMRGQYDINVENGNHIIIVLGESLAPAFIRADINGIEIPFISEVVTIGDNTYKVYTSENTYQAGTYNIDING